MSLVLWFSESYPRTTFSGSTPVSSAAARVKRPPNTSLTSRPSGRIKTAAVMCSVLTPCLTNRRHWILMWNMGYRISHIRRGRGWRCSALATVISWVSLNTFFFFSFTRLPLFKCLTTANSWTVTVGRWPESRAFQNELCGVMVTRPHPTLTESRSDSITEATQTGNWVKKNPKGNTL